MRTVPCRFTYLNIVGQVGRAVWKAKETLEGKALLKEKHCRLWESTVQPHFQFILSA